MRVRVRGAAWLAGFVAGTGLLAACAAPAASPPPTEATRPPWIESSAAPAGGTTPEPITAVLPSDVSEADLRTDLDALARMSGKADGYRAVGSAGFDAAAEYVAEELRAAGWSVSEDAFTTPAFTDPGGSEVVVDGRSFGAGDVLPLIFSPAGDVTGPVVALDWEATATEPSSLGCAAADYGDLPDGALVVVRSGPCRRRDAVLAAQTAGAAGFVAAYPAAGTGEVLRPTLFEPAGITIPVASASGIAAGALADAAAAGATARLVTTTATSLVPTRSIIADLPGRRSDAVVMLGGHLDSVIDGPGLNDNGSGVAALLGLARALRDHEPRSTIRLAFWTDEETGLHGSFHYVEGLAPDDRAAIHAYLNADMVASPNGVAGVYDESRAAPGSAAISDLLVAAVREQGSVPVPEDVGGGSDHLAFTLAGIPTGGVYSGANELITPEQATASGATVGQPADPCYHRPCDDGTDLDVELARVLATALARTAVQLADDPGILDR